MGKKKDKKMANMFMPPFPGMVPPAPMFPMPMNANFGQEDAKAKAQEVKSNVKGAWEKAIDMQKGTLDNSKDQFSQFFAYIMDMQDGFAETLPEQLPSIPGMPAIPVSPKGLMKALKEFEEMANNHLVEQVDLCVSFFFDVQEKAMTMVPDAPQAAEDEAAEDEAAEDEAEDTEAAEDAE